MTTDKNGYLWIATTEGLNKYDGYSVTPLLKEKNPSIPDDNLNLLYCDSKNRIWLAGNNGVAMIDISRRINKIAIDSFNNFSAGIIIETKSDGIVIIGGQYFYSLQLSSDPLKPLQWKRLAWATPFLHRSQVHDVVQLQNDQYLFVEQNRAVIIDFALHKEIFAMEFPLAWTGCRINDKEVMLASRHGQLFRLDVPQKKIIKSYLLPGDINHSAANTSIFKTRAVSDSEILISTTFRGVYSFNSRNEKFRQYQHDPLNTYSLSENRTENIFFDSIGNIFVISSHTGLNIFNNRYYKAIYLPALSDGRGNIFDGYINDVALDKKQRIWLAAFDRVILYDKEKNTTRFFPFYKNIDGLGLRAMEIKSICIDSSGLIWAGVYEQGVLMLNEQSGRFKIITTLDTLHQQSPLNSDYIHDLLQGPDGQIWGCSGRGVFAINTKTLKADPFINHDVLKTLNGIRIIKIFCDREKRLWFASQQNGAYCYDIKNNSLKNYNEKNGMPSSSCHNFAEDRPGNIFVSTGNGLAVIKTDESIQVFNKTNGLKSNFCNGLLSDKEGKIWIANNTNMICYSPQGNTFKYFGNESGFPGCGFRTNSYYQAADGQLFWGTEKGFINFHPELLTGISQLLTVNISKLILADSVIQFTNDASLSLSHTENNISLNFSAIELTGSKNIFYRYILEGFDNKWNTEPDITQVKYNSLPSGNYTFKVKASKDGINWTDSSNTIHIRIKLPYWKTRWFKALAGLLCISIITGLYFWQRKRRMDKEKLRIEYEKKIAAVEMNTLRAQMNPHFIFNSLNSINTFILKNDSDNAAEYLQKFSSLVRLILNNSRSEWILLENEVKALELYIELESLRFEHVFAHNISISPGVNMSSAWVPPLIIQPYVENAIRHGLINRKTPGGKLSVNVWKENNELLIQVEDNGIGRQAAEAMKSKINKLHQPSHGMKISAERLDIVNDVYKVNAGVQITDLIDEGNKGAGTRVLLTIQYKTNAGNNH